MLICGSDAIARHMSSGILMEVATTFAIKACMSRVEMTLMTALMIGAIRIFTLCALLLQVTRSAVDFMKK